jgi:hypothetical protein
MMIASRNAVLLIVALASVAFGCAPRRVPVLEPLQAIEEKTPVVLIAGITGSMLRDRETGKVQWGNARRFFVPHDGGYAIARPIAPGVEDRLEAFAPILTVKLLGIWKFDVYAQLVRLMEANGYRMGDLDDPRPEDDFFFFSYDWRYGNVRAAEDLARKLEELRRVRGEETLEVSFVCQSNAARIARYFVKYGGGSLEQAESGTAKRPAAIEVDKLILLGTANGGGLRVLNDLHRGRRYVRPFGRKLRPETVFTMWSVYEALPAYHEDLFIDATGRTLDVDLFDPENWKRYGWSVYRPKVRNRLHGTGRTELFGQQQERDAFLVEALGRAQRLHRLLEADVEDFGETRYYSIQARDEPTPARALLEPDGEKWRMRVSLDKSGRKRWPMSHTDGDGFATLDSQMWLSPQERDALAHEPVFVDTTHRKIVLDGEAHRRILEFLLDGDSATD